MSYNVPVSSRIVLHSRVAQPATNNTLSNVSFSSVDIGSQYLSNGSPPTNFNAPYAGVYTVYMEGWCCGIGSGEVIVTSTRSAVIQYAQQKFVVNGCFNSGCPFVIPSVQAGDVITIQADFNTTGTPITSITNSANPYVQGVCTIYFYPSN